MAPLSTLAKLYYTRWAQVATNGNVKFSTAYDVFDGQTRVCLECELCGSSFGFTPNAPSTAIDVPHDAQTFINFHAHRSEPTPPRQVQLPIKINPGRRFR